MAVPVASNDTGSHEKVATDALLFDANAVVGGYERSPADVLRVVGFALLTLLLMAVTRWGRESILGVERSLLELLGFLTPTWERVLGGVLQIVVALVLVMNYLLPLFTRRFRLFGYVVLVTVLGGLASLAVQNASNFSDNPVIINRAAQLAGVSRVFPAPWALTGMAAIFVVAGPFVTDRWRKAGAWTLAVVVGLRLVVSSYLPLDTFVSVALGAAVGALVLAVLGRPNHRPTVGAVGAALRANGLDVAEIHPASVDARGSTPYFATLSDGQKVFAKALGNEERSADLLFRLYRSLRFRHLGDYRPFSSLRRTVEHEAFVALVARDVGIRTPRLRAVTSVGSDSMALAYDQIDGASLDSVPPEALTDEVLADLWSQVALMQRHRIAHRDLRKANVFLDADQNAWIIDFGFSEAAADDTLLETDIAQFMAALAIDVGVDRTLDAAIAAVGTDAVAGCLSRLQRKALSGATQTRLKDHPHLLDELRTTAAERCGIEPPELEPLDRVNGKKIFTLVMLAAVTYFLVPQLADLPGIFGEIKDASWGWAVPTILASVFTYIGAAISLTGSVPARLPAGPTFVAQVGSSYASKLAPAGFGGMALNVRYLQKVGVDTTVATSSVGLNSVGGVVGHITMLLLFLVWAGRDAFGSIQLPDPTVFLIGIGVVAAIALIAMAIPPVRHIVVTKLWPIVNKAGGGLRDVLSRPGKLALLIGGSALVSLSYITAVYFAGQAFGCDLSYAQIGAIYLAGSAVATAAPTPGGLGALEAALIAGFVAAGESRNIAVPLVFFYRLATFWLPILPGAFSFGWLRRHDYL